MKVRMQLYTVFNVQISASGKKLTRGVPSQVGSRYLQKVSELHISAGNVHIPASLFGQDIYYVFQRLHTSLVSIE